MATIEQIRDGLLHCLNDTSCEGCLYNHVDSKSFMSCTAAALYQDIIDRLQETEAKLLTLVEVQKHNNRDGCIWAEFKDFDLLPVFVGSLSKDDKDLLELFHPSAFGYTDEHIIYGRLSTYDQRWRAWSCKPTEDQMSKLHWSSRDQCPMKGSNGSCFIAGSFCKDVDDKTCTMIHAAYSFGNLPDEDKQKAVNADSLSPYVLSAYQVEYEYFDSHSRGWVEYQLEEGGTRLEWLEYLEEFEGVFKFWKSSRDIPKKFREEYYNKDYGTPGWRVWSSKPTEQHRKQVKWDG